MPRCETLLFNDPDSIVLCGDQPDMVERALKLGVNCIILCQITTLDSAKMLERSGEFLAEMRRMKADHGYDMVILMLTDVLLEGTQLLYVGSDDTIRRAFSAEPKDNMLFLPGVMSRKKQIIPMLTALWG